MIALSQKHRPTNMDKDFSTFYRTDLEPKLIAFEKQHQSFVKKLSFLFFVYSLLMTTAILAIVALFIMTPENCPDWLFNSGMVLTSLSMIVLTVELIRSYRQVKPYNNIEFKKHIITPIVRFVDEGLSFDPEKQIAVETFEASHLFQEQYGDTVDLWTGQDYVEGTLGKIKVKFSEVHAQEEKIEEIEIQPEVTEPVYEYEAGYEPIYDGWADQKEYDGWAQQRDYDPWKDSIRTKVEVPKETEIKTYQETVFKGLFFVYDFQLDFTGVTLILPNEQQGGLLSGLGNWFEKLLFWRTKNQRELIKLGDPEIDREFVIYSDNPAIARHVISNRFMHRLLDFRRRLEKPVYLSFVNGKFHLAIEVAEDLFEPPIFDTVLNYQLLKEFFEYMQLGKDIVEDLMANLRDPNELPTLISPMENSQLTGISKTTNNQLNKLEAEKAIETLKNSEALNFKREIEFFQDNL